MEVALELAQNAADSGEVPVGAVIVHDGEIIGRGYNRTITDHDPSAHAEVMAIRDAANHLGTHRLQDATLVVTLEPCMMCAGAILQARLQRVVFSAWDERWGAVGSIINALDSPLMNHRCEVISGVAEQQSQDLLQDFFAARR